MSGSVHMSGAAVDDEYAAMDTARESNAEERAITAVAAVVRIINEHDEKEGPYLGPITPNSPYLWGLAEAIVAGLAKEHPHQDAELVEPILAVGRS